MNWPTLKLLYVHEMRMMLRSRRAVVMSIVIPALLMPLMLFGSRYSGNRTQQRMNQETFEYAVTGPWAERARALIDDLSSSSEFENFHIREVETTDPDADLRQGNLRFYVKTLTTEEADTESSADDLKGITAIQVFFRGNQDISRRSADRMVRLLRLAQRNESNSRLLDRGFPADPSGIFTVTDHNVATDSQVSGSTVGRFLTVFLVMLIFTGGSIAATDIIAGEKERGTLETLITTAAGRTEIVTAKQLAIFSVALVTTLLQALNFLVYVQLRLIPMPESFSLDIPLAHVVALLFLFVPLAATISAMLLIISGYARTYKEAQMHFFPVYMVSLAPALASVLPGIRLRSIVAFVPIANVSVAVREVLMGRPDIPMIGVTFVVMSMTALALIGYSARLLTREDLVVASQRDQDALIGGERLFRRRVLWWFAVMWAAMFAFAANVRALQQFQAQLLFNELVIFLGASLLMIQRYRLGILETLRLRPVRWPVWLGIIVAVPAGHITTMAFFQLVNMVIPVSETMLREFGRQIVPPNLPVWQLYLFVCVLPGICEEIAFRGVLLRGLRHRFRPVVLALVVGLIFGVFHYALFRIAPTAFLGVILTAVAMVTGSILPGMLFHALNNGLAVWMDTNSVQLEDVGWPIYLAGISIFALAMWIIYRASPRNTSQR